MVKSTTPDRHCCPGQEPPLDMACLPIYYSSDLSAVGRLGQDRKRGRREQTCPPRPVPTPSPPGQSLPCPSCSQDFATPPACLGNVIARGGAAQQFPEALTPPPAPHRGPQRPLTAPAAVEHISSNCLGVPTAALPINGF